jgi:predicted aspartyl protease
MGITAVQLQVANPANLEHWETVDCLVDSGASYSVVPAEVLERLGIQPYTEQVFRLANGEHMRRRKGIAAHRLGDRTGGMDIIFGEQGDANLVGVLTLEALGFALDPLRRELREMPMLMLRLDHFA